MIRQVLSILLLLALPLGAARAQEAQFPGRYDVAGVSSDDVLNIRIGPSAHADIIGRLAPDATGIEVVRVTNRGLWGLVSTGEGNGWVRMRYLAAQEATPDDLPRPLTCLGTEPFWSLQHGEEQTLWQEPGAEPAPLEVKEIRVTEGSYLTVSDSEGGQRFALTVKRQTCSDGMSDREYGFTASLRRGAAEPLRGCCTLDAR